MHEVWWLVVKKHPFKQFINEKNFFYRINKIENICKNSKIKIITNKKFTENKYSIFNLKKIIKTHKKINFIWLMGADNLYNFHKWYKWKEIYKTLPIVIFDRPQYSNIALASKAAKLFFKYRYPETFSRKLSATKAPAWIFLHSKLNYYESRILRKKNGK